MLYGMGDRTLSSPCSNHLNDSYGSSSRGRERTHLFDGDDHAPTRNSLKAEGMLCDFIMKSAGVEIAEDEQKEMVQRPLIDGREKIEINVPARIFKTNRRSSSGDQLES